MVDDAAMTSPTLEEIARRAEAAKLLSWARKTLRETRGIHVSIDVAKVLESRLREAEAEVQRLAQVLADTIEKADMERSDLQFRIARLREALKEISEMLPLKHAGQFKETEESFANRLQCRARAALDEKEHPTEPSRPSLP